MKKINKQIILCSVIIANSVFAQVDYKFNGAVTKNNDAPNGYYTDNGSQYTKYNNGTSNRCNNAPNGYYTDNGNQYIMSGNNLSNNNNIPDDYYIDNNNQYVLCNRDKSILNIDDNYDINSQMDKIQKEADNILK